MVYATLNLALAQGMCPMCATMGMWMILFWILIIAVIIGAVWMFTRRSRR